MTLVSVVVPTHNKCRYLELTLASFQRQTCSDFEIIVVDDGSTDETAGLLARWPDPRVRKIHQANRGRSGARNTGVKTVRGDWVVFCDDDRLVAPNFIEAHVRRLREDPRSVVLGFKQRVLTYWRRGELPLELNEWLTVANRTPGLAAQMMAADRLLLCTPKQLADEFEATIARILVGDEADNHQDLLAICADDLTRLPMAWALGTTANLSVARRYLDGDQTFDERYRGWGLEDTDLCYRLHLKGLTIFFERAAVNYHQVHPLGETSLREGVQTRSRECEHNFRRFCQKFGTLESYLLWRSMNGLGLMRAQELLERASDDVLLRDELAWNYHEVLRLRDSAAEPTAFGGVVSGQALVGTTAVPLRPSSRTQRAASALPVAC